jgi:hypothetical protein
MTEQPASFSGAWNLGPCTNDTLTVKEVVEKAIAVFGKGCYSNSTTKQPAA